MLTILFLVPVVGFIILGTTKFKLHPFLTLLLAAVFMGFLGGLDATSVIAGVTEGFGDTLRSIGIVIACGTIIGTFLEKSGGARTMASAVLCLVGEKKSPLAMSITGYLVSIPVFCDSGFVILSALNRALSRRTRIPLTVLAVALATGLYTTHVFVPPTPGPLAAAAAVGADIGLVTILGLLVSIPTAGVGLLWAGVIGRRFPVIPRDVEEDDRVSDASGDRESSESAAPGAAASFAPLLAPVALIALKSIADYPTTPFGSGIVQDVLVFIGHPVTALIVGVFLAFGLRRGVPGASTFDWVGEGLKTAGAIILITGAGGAFGNVLRATGVGDGLGQVMAQWHLSIFLPFLIAAVIKTAQGSSTVAIITTAALVAPLLAPMGLDSAVGRVLVVLAVGAGAMTVSHVNDSYFWVVSQFSDMDTSTALRCHTLATLLQGLAGILTIAVLAWILV